MGAGASSHREAPLTSADPQIDQTDVYAFRSPDRPDTVTMIGSWLPFQEPAGGPNFYQWAEDTNYDSNIDNDGDAVPDVKFRWRFTTHYRDPGSFIYNNGPVTSLRDENLLISQTYDLYRIVNSDSRKVLNDVPVVPSNVGRASMPGYNRNLFDAGVTRYGDARVWVGQSDDPFFLDLRVFDLLYGGDFSEVGDDTLAGFNVNTVAIQVPRSWVRGKGSVIGVWHSASRPSMRVQTSKGTQNYRGELVKVSRLGMPLVNEVVVPVGTKDYFNGSRPVNDAQFLPAVNDPELARLITAVYPSVFPEVPDSRPGRKGVQRDDLIQVFLTGIEGLNMPANVRPSEMLRLNIDTPQCSDACSPLGVIDGDLAGFPNGRRLADDVLDVSLRVVEGVLLPDHDPDADNLGDGVDSNDVRFLDMFPYVAYPHAGSDPNPHG
ncbi:DUF4331 domain-containing protein [soil metagenome]